MPHSNLVSRIRAEVARAAHPAVLVGCSGGPDSLCLTDALLSIGARVVLAHVNHGLRDVESDGDEVFVRDFAAARGVDCVVERIDVAAHARAVGESIELTARRARYAFFARAAARACVAHVAVAHHADDQAETVLLRLLRGTGIEGLRAMAVSAPLPGAPELTLLRPLLRIPRADIERYCADLGLQPRRDSSNDSAAHTRNRVRFELLPLLRTFNPGIARVLARLADLAAADHEVQQWAAQRAFDEIARGDAHGVHVDRAAWRTLPVGLQRAVLRECVRVVRADLTNLNYDAIEEVRDVLLSDAVQAASAITADVRVELRGAAFAVRTLVQSAAMEAADQPLPARAREAVAQFNAGLYWEQHETFEEVWRAEPRPIRRLYQGILQVGVAYLHIERCNYDGAHKVFLRAMRHLEILPAVCQGVDVAQLRADASAALAELERLGPQRVAEFPREMMRPLVGTGIT